MKLVNINDLPVPLADLAITAWKQRDVHGRAELQRRVNDADASGQPYRVTVIVEPCR